MSEVYLKIMAVVIPTCISATVAIWLWWNNRPALHFSKMILSFKNAANLNTADSGLVFMVTYRMAWFAEALVSNRGRMKTTLLGEALMHIEGRTIAATIDDDTVFEPGDCRSINIRFNDDDRPGPPTAPVSYKWELQDAFGKRYCFKGTYLPDSKAQ